MFEINILNKELKLKFIYNFIIIILIEKLSSLLKILIFLINKPILDKLAISFIF